MLQATRARRVLLFPLIMAFLLSGFASQSAVAGIVGTDTILAERAGATERASLEMLLDRQDVQQTLVKYGVSPQEAAERVAALTDEEALELAQRIDELPAGGSTVALLLVIIILLLLLR